MPLDAQQNSNIAEWISEYPELAWVFESPEFVSMFAGTQPPKEINQQWNRIVRDLE